MSRYTQTLGSTTFTPFAGFAHAYSSNWTPGTSNTNTNGAVSPASGTDRPLMVSSLTLYLQSASGGAGNFACGANSTFTVRQNLSANIGDLDDNITRAMSYPGYANETLYYGFIKSDTVQTNFYSGSASGINIYSNGSTLFSGRAIYGALQIDTIPSAVQSLSASPASSSSISVSWSAPADDGGPGISGYQVSWQTGGGSWSHATTGSTSYTISGLSSSTTYSIRVAATNAVTTTHNSTFGYSGDQAIVGTASTTSATTSTAFLTPSFTDGVANRSYKVGDSVSEIVAANYTYNYYGQGGTNYSLSTSIPGISIIDYGTYGAIVGTVGSISTSSYNVTATALGPGGSSTNTGSWSISQALPSWTDDTLASGRVGTSYSSTISASNTSYWSISSVPSGLTASDTSGTTATITGTPTNYGNFSVSATPYNTDNASGGTRSISLSVLDAYPSWADQTLATTTITEGEAYSDGVSVASGPISITYSVTPGYSLPSGLSLNSSTGAITGTPDTAGSYIFRIRATNGTSETIDTGNLSLTVEAAGGYVKVRSGGAWVDATAKVRSGGAWVDGTVQIRNSGGSWTTSFTQ